MSDPVAKARRSRAKDARQMPAPERARIKAKKKAKPDKPWHVVGPNFRGREMVWTKCATEVAAITQMEKLNRGSINPARLALQVAYRPKR